MTQHLSSGRDTSMENMMESFKIAAVSMNSPFDELDWVFGQMDDYCREAAN